VDNKLERQAKKQLKKDSRGNTQTLVLKEFQKFLAEKKEMIKSSERSNVAKREYSDIDQGGVVPLTLASKYIPVKDIKEGIIITRDNRFLKIIELDPINYALKPETEKTAIIRAFEEYLRVAPSKMQIKIISRHATTLNMIQTIDIEESKEKNKKVKELYEDHKNFIRETAMTEAISRNFFIIYQYEPGTKLQSNNFKAAKRQLEDIEATAMKYLKNCGNEVYDLSEDASHNQADILYRILNRQRSDEIPFGINMVDVENKWIAQNGEGTEDMITAADYISPWNISFKNKHYVKVDDIYYSHMGIASNGYHENVGDAWFSFFTNLGEGIDVDLFITKYNREAMINKIYQSSKINRLRLNDAQKANSEKESVSNLQESVDAATYIRTEMINNEQDFYHINTLITTVASTPEGVAWKLKAVKKILKSKRFKIFNCYNKQEDAFFSYLPFLNIDKQIFAATKQNVLTSGLAYFYPFTSYSFYSENGIMFGISELNKSIVSLDNFNTKKYKNANMVVLGTSGAGKTYALETIALRYRLKHIPVSIIAPLKGEEFARACEKVGGSFISISPASSKCINIMEIRDKDRVAARLIDGEIIENSLLVEKVQSLLIFFSILVPDITYEEKQLVDEAIVSTYREFGITQNNKSIYDEFGQIKTMPILGDLHKILDSNPETKRIANILKRLTVGSARTFNQQTNVDLDNEYTIIDISHLTGDMLLVGMFIALDFVWSKAKENKTKKKVVIIDEMWKLLGTNELAAEYILELFKVIRGYGGCAVGATQDLVDFYALANGKYGKGIINNSKIKIVLQLEHDEAMAVQKALALTDEEIEKVEAFDRGQAILIANRNNVIVNIKASKMEHYYITSDNEDLIEIAKGKERVTNKSKYAL
jgi:hypothetical protein